MFLIPQISFLVVHLPLYKQKIGLKSHLDIPENSTFLDVIACLDYKFWKKIFPRLSEREQKQVLLFKHCRSLLQVIWNPETNQIYSDVLFEARVDFSQRETLPLLQNFDYILQEGADITLGPDQG